MDAFFLLYALTISLELILSIVMAAFLYLIVAPSGAARGQAAPTEERHSPRPLARTVDGALGDAFASVSEGRDELAVITNARALLVRYREERCASDRPAG
jgi:hypothetical protein